MAQNKQLAKLIRTVRKLQGDIRALTGIGGIGPPKPPRKELIRMLERLRKALNRAILSVEKRIARDGKKAARRR